MTENAKLRAFDAPLPELDGASILVTGATGTFGKAFVAAVIEKYKPQRLIVFSRDELKQSEMQAVYPTSRYSFMRYFIGDVRDPERLEMAARLSEAGIERARNFSWERTARETCKILKEAAASASPA
jgi:dTDP-D-glucose 4,6-dehydratase